MRLLPFGGSRAKLLGTVAGLCAITALVGYLGLHTAYGVMTTLGYFEDVLVPGNIAALSVREGLRNARQQAALAADPATLASDLPRLHSQFMRYMGNSRRAVDDYGSLRLSDAEQALIPDLRAAQQAYIAATDELWLELPGQSADRQAKLDRYQTRAEPNAARVDLLVGRLVALEGQRTSDEATSARMTYDGASSVLLATIVAGIAAALSIGLVVARTIASPKEEAELTRQALHDALTGLPNRMLLAQRLGDAIDNATSSGRPFALLLLDLDRFKDVNDTLGHHAGDRLLQEIARRIRACLRAADTCARLGGDEFAALLPETSAAGAASLAAMLIDALERPVMLDDQEVSIGASVGIALFPDHGADATTLLRRADMAMYSAKRARGQSTIYSPNLDRDSSDRLALVSRLRHAIAVDELLLHYQPKVDCQSGAFLGVEALVRWQHPERGLLAPDHFIPIAEQSGLIKPVTRWVLDAALRQCRAWLDAGLEVPLAVNLSGHDVQDLELPVLIGELLERWAVPPTWLTLEVTESAAIADSARAIGILSALRDTGVRIAIDDFGTGYSSFAHLKRLPISEIKIDRSFVLELGGRSADLAIVRSIIELGQRLGVATLAEGVEDGDTLAMLAALGCAAAQGYFLGRPAPASELPGWLARAASASPLRAAA